MVEPTRQEPSPRAFWIGMAVGAPIIVLGVRGILVNAADAHPAELTSWLVGSAIVHDALVLPLVAGVAVLGRRLAPGWAWPAVRWGLATSAILLVVSRPFVTRWGYDPANPTALPRNYGVGVAIAIALVWLATAAWAAALRHRRPRPVVPRPDRAADGRS